MYRRVRGWIVVGALLILAAGFLRFRLEQGQPLLQLAQARQQVNQIEEATIAERGDIRVTVSATGSINPVERVPLLFTLPGKVTEIYVQEGDFVQEGQPLARLDTADLELALDDSSLALELQQVAYDALTASPRDVDLQAAQAAVYAAGAQLAAANVPPDARTEQIAAMQLEIARNQLWQQQMQRDSTVEQQEFLEGLSLPPIPSVPSGSGIPDFSFALAGLIPNTTQSESSVTRSEFDVAIAEQGVLQAQNATVSASNVAAAQAALASAQSNLQRLLEGPSEVDLALADAQLQIAYLSIEMARYQVSQATLTAPFSGLVTQVNLTVGEAPPTSQAAVELIDNTAYFIDLAVDEIDIAQVAAGQHVEVELDALPDVPITGVVTRVDAVATDLGGLITYRVRVTLEPTDVTLRVGMSATATIVVDEVFGVVRVRNRFIRLDRRTGQAFVAVRHSDGTLEEVEVTLGHRNETYSEILAGVNEGEEIVLLPRESFGDFGF